MSSFCTTTPVTNPLSPPPPLPMCVAAWL